MAAKSLLVHLNDERRLPAVMQTAISVATSQDAHLQGLVLLPPAMIVATAEDVVDVSAFHRERYLAEVARMKAAFTSALEGSGVSASWHEVDCRTERPFADAGSVAVDFAHCADLVIAAAGDPSWPLSDILDLEVRLVMESGRPVLIVPQKTLPQTLGKRIVLAWNGRREAARAAFDALPFLLAAESVTVLTINPQDDLDTAGDVPAADICAALARHGVHCAASQSTTHGENVGRTLLAAVKRQGADMLVMGCYGHSRLRELVLGGASRHIFDHIDVPVLMAH
jgi:nucleotide-binding universal stress UspA family protein